MITERKFQVMVQKPVGWDVETSLFIGMGDDPAFRVFQPVTLFQVNPGDAPPVEPFLKLETKSMMAFMQAMMDAAWDMGLKPKSYEEPTHAMQVQGKHLSDMRAIVAKQLGVELPR